VRFENQARLDKNLQQKAKSFLDITLFIGPYGWCFLHLLLFERRDKGILCMASSAAFFSCFLALSFVILYLRGWLD